MMTKQANLEIAKQGMLTCIFFGDTKFTGSIHVRTPYHAKPGHECTTPLLLKQLYCIMAGIESTVIVCRIPYPHPPASLGLCAVLYVVLLLLHCSVLLFLFDVVDHVGCRTSSTGFR